MANKKTILIIEDNELNRDILTCILEDKYRVLAAPNGAEGLFILNEHGSDIALILLDIQMPVMDGYQFLEAVRADGTHIDIPIIVTTAGDSDEEQIRCLDCGASDFISKPYNPEIIKKRVAGLIRLRETTILLHKVEHDELTGLYNREFFAAYASQMLLADTSVSYDMICMEIESYRLIHSRYGTDKCNAFIRSFTDNLLNRLPEGALCGRIDEDKFVVLIRHTAHMQYQIYMAACKEGLFTSLIPNVRINCGIYTDIDRSLSISVIINNAFMPIDRIRHRYDKNVAVYDEALRKKMAFEQTLSSDAASAVAKRQLQVHYQPKYDAQHECTGGAEALVRWQHPQFGLLMPSDFIHIFESNGFIYEIDLYVLQTVCEQLQNWISLGRKVVPVSINISQVDFDRTYIADEFERIIDRYGIPHHLIHFEITESAELSDKLKKSEAIRRLSDKGFLIELDDFGIGYSTLSSLGELPIDIMKIDLSLIRNMFDAKYNSILKGIIYTAASLKFKIVAEGVETQEQVSALKDMCAGNSELFIQGFCYSKPLPASEFEAFLA